MGAGHPDRELSGYYRDEFNRLALVYDFGVRMTFRAIGGEAAFRRTIAGALDVRPGQRVLDVGCGTGTLLKMLSDPVGPSGRLTGVDLSPGMLKVARAKLCGLPAELVLANAEELPFPDASFDRVTTSLAVHEMTVTGRLNTLKEMRRVLKPGGIAAVAEMRPPDTWFLRLAARFMGLVETATLSDMWQNGLFREMGEAGFRERRRKITGHGFFEIVTGRP